MIKIIPNFLDEQTFSKFVSSFDRSKTEPVEYSPNVLTIKYNRIPLREVMQYGKVSFIETLFYTNGAFSPSHVDHGPLDEWNDWKSTGILYCTDDYDGGEIFFSKLNIIMKPKKNTFIMFPAGIGTNIYEHGVHPVISGERIATVFRFVE